MIIYGIKHLTKESYQLPTNCQSCGQEGLILTRLARFRHIYWLPIFPLGNRAAIHCLHCRWTRSDDDLTSDDRKNISQFFPLNGRKYLVGYALLAILSVGGLLFYHQENNKAKAQRVQEFVSAPKADTFVFVDSGEKDTPYTYFRVEAARDNDVLIRAGSYHSKKLSGLDEISKIKKEMLEFARYYEGHFRVIAKADLAKLKILDVK